MKAAAGTDGVCAPAFVLPILFSPPSIQTGAQWLPPGSRKLLSPHCEARGALEPLIYKIFFGLTTFFTLSFLLFLKNKRNPLALILLLSLCWAAQPPLSTTLALNLVGAGGNWDSKTGYHSCHSPSCIHDLKGLGRTNKYTQALKIPMFEVTGVSVSPDSGCKCLWLHIYMEP